MTFLFLGCVCFSFGNLGFPTSEAYRSNARIEIAVPSSLKIHAFSHGAGHMRPQMAGKGFCKRIRVNAPTASSSRNKRINPGISIPSGQPGKHVATAHCGQRLASSTFSFLPNPRMTSPMLLIRRSLGWMGKFVFPMTAPYAPDLVLPDLQNQFYRH